MIQYRCYANNIIIFILTKISNHYSPNPIVRKGTLILTYMNKLIGIILLCCFAASCTSQSDLEALKFDEDISKIIKDHSDLKKRADPVYGFKAYSTNKLDGFKIGSVKISTYEVPKGNASDHSSLWIYVDDYDANKILGYEYSSANEKESEKVVAELKSKYKDYKTNTNKIHGDFYFWDLPESNKWIFVDQSDNINHIQTTFTVVKRGLRVGNSTDPSVFSLYEKYKMMQPDVLK